MILENVGDVLLKNIKVKLPENRFSLAIETWGLPKEVWLNGPALGDWFVRKEHDDKQVFPLFADFLSWDELKNWEVVEIYKET